LKREGFHDERGADARLNAEKMPRETL